jgi:uncharacterized protein (TIGR02646 family)
VTFQKTPDTSVDPPRRARYDGPGFEDVKPHVRDALHAEQRGLCCYCNGAIQPTAAAMKIEHRVPQHGAHGDPARDLDWTNLFGACLGRTAPRGGREALHCDASKGDAALSFDPSNVSHVATVGYQGARITSSREDFQREFDEVLRLNDAPREARRRALDDVQAELARRYPDKRFPTDKLRRLREQTRSPAAMRLRPYAGFIASWLDTRIRQQSGG